MKRSMFHTCHALMLIVALIFGQVGAGFLHNKHDAHEAVIDLDSDAPVLLNHGEHCKVCAIDWVHQFLAEDFKVAFEQEKFAFPISQDTCLFDSSSFDLSSSRAPPFFS